MDEGQLIEHYSGFIWHCVNKVKLADSTLTSEDLYQEAALALLELPSDKQMNEPYAKTTIQNAVLKQLKVSRWRKQAAKREDRELVSTDALRYAVGEAWEPAEHQDPTQTEALFNVSMESLQGIEHDCLDLALRGFKEQEIGRILGVSQDAVNGALLSATERFGIDPPAFAPKKGRTKYERQERCSGGHLLQGDNIYVVIRKDRKRPQHWCRLCKNLNQAEARGRITEHGIVPKSKTRG